MYVLILYFRKENSSSLKYFPQSVEITASFFIWVTMGTILMAQIRTANLKWAFHSLWLLWHLFLSYFLLDDDPWEGGDKFEGFQWNCIKSTVPLTGLYIQVFALKFYEGYPCDYAVPQESQASFYELDEKCSWALLTWPRIHAEHRIYCDSTFSRAVLFPFLCKPLKPTFQQKNVRLTSTSKLMQFCWFSTQEAESCWGPCSPNNLAVWCFPLNLARIAERWCSAVRPRDTLRPSTGNTHRHVTQNLYVISQSSQVQHFYCKPSETGFGLWTSWLAAAHCPLTPVLIFTVSHGEIWEWWINCPQLLVCFVFALADGHWSAVRFILRASCHKYHWPLKEIK